MGQQVEQRAKHYDDRAPPSYQEAAASSSEPLLGAAGAGGYADVAPVATDVDDDFRVGSCLYSISTVYLLDRVISL